MYLFVYFVIKGTDFAFVVLSFVLWLKKVPAKKLSSDSFDYDSSLNCVRAIKKLVFNSSEMSFLSDSFPYCMNSSEILALFTLVADEICFGLSVVGPLLVIEKYISSNTLMI